VTALLREVAQTGFASPPPLWIWSATEGMRRDGEEGSGEAREPREALDFIIRHDGAGLFLLKDLHEAIRDAPEIRRRLRDLYERCSGRSKFAFISAPVKVIPEEIAHDVFYIQLGVPDLPELATFVRREGEAITAAGGTVDTSDATLHQVTRALQGLTIDEARHAIRRALIHRH